MKYYHRMSVTSCGWKRSLSQDVLGADTSPEGEKHLKLNENIKFNYSEDQNTEGTRNPNGQVRMPQNWIVFTF